MRLFNSLTNKKELFIPIINNQVKIYVCGQTVYDYCHLGHTRKAIVFDMIRRWFISLGYKVTFVENITDIDDKIIAKALNNNETIMEVTTRYTKYMHEDFERLGILKPDFEPKATDYIPQMLAIIDNLIKKGYAYKADNNDIYYAVDKFNQYGKLSGKNLKHLNAGERVKIDEFKRNPLDFVLWKSVKNDEPSWPSPFGNGRPGWHIECSAMSGSLLGKTFDIHGGGQDLQFPHHENEIAQSEANNDCILANYWLHNGFLNINETKMSKSLGNFYTLRDILNNYNYHPEVIRLFMLKTHYRSPIDFNFTLLDDSKNLLTKFYLAIQGIQLEDNFIIAWDDKISSEFAKAMNDDFNTPLAISVLLELLAKVNKQQQVKDISLLIALANKLGLLLTPSADFLQYGSLKLNEEHINQLIVQRNKARLDKDFILADKIRKNLSELGVIINDSDQNTTWRVK